jgi:hypothetical protein
MLSAPAQLEGPRVISVRDVSEIDIGAMNSNHYRELEESKHPVEHSSTHLHLEMSSIKLPSHLSSLTPDSSY